MSKGVKAAGGTGLEWISAAVTDVGLIRKFNEDAILDRSDRGLWVVADGMGGHEAGDVASATIVETLDAVPPPQNFMGHVNSVEELILDANRLLLKYSSEHLNNRTVGSTVAALVSWQGHAAVLWVGDSRVYRLRDGDFQQISKDHTEVQNLVDQGLITADEMERHPSRNILSRAVGVDPGMDVDRRIVDIQIGDKFLLCSDGLMKELSDPQIASVIDDKGIKQSVEVLRDQALQKGCRDNISIILVAIH